MATRPTKTAALRKKTRTVTQAHPNLSRARPDPEMGHPFRFDAKSLPNIARGSWKALAKAAHSQLGLDEDALGWAMRETARRLHGTRPTDHKVVGTFIEVVASVSDTTSDIRDGMARACLMIHIRDMVNGEASFFSNAVGKLDDAGDADGFRLGIDALPLSAKARRDAQRRMPRRAAGMTDEAWESAIDAFAESLVDDLHGELIHARDTLIGSKDFVDRAVLLPLSDGRVILLLSEEYKAPSAGSGGQQSSLRINRIFNPEVGAATGFSYTPTSDARIADRMRMGAALDDGALVEMTMGQVIVSSSTRGVDQLLVKASRSGSEGTSIAAKTRNRALTARKREYGENLRAGKKKIDLTYFKYNFQLPGRELRNLLALIHREG